MNKKICLLITGVYRDFIYSYNNTKFFYEFDKIHYDIFFLMSETDNIELKKNEIKEIFKDNLKYLHNIFDNDTETIIYKNAINNLKIKYDNTMNTIKEKYNDINFMYPTHVIFEQFYKISLIQKIRKEYEEKNNFKYDIIIRTRPDICIIDDNYYIHSGPYNDYNINGIYHGTMINKSELIKNNILNISSLLKRIDIKKNINFSICCKDFISINSNYAADKEIDMIDNLLFTFENFYQKNNINDIIEYLNNKYQKYSYTIN
jgi:hypothetical protein